MALTRLQRITYAARHLLETDAARALRWVSGAWECRYCGVRRVSEEGYGPGDHADDCPWLVLYEALEGVGV